ncbi:MAG TPA: Sec-independent protein translocase protein TatB [Sphingomonas sp.]|nr:Sec-independent protein translocase protein TatB [Sphingomonas sp.]
MFDVAPTELLLVAFIAIVVIGPKDLPKAMRFVGYWVGRARGVARQFRAGFDAMVREAELEEMEKRWKEENERIMREHPTSETAALPAPETSEDSPDDAASGAEALDADEPVMVEKPAVRPAEPDADTPPPADKAAS